ncbi:hypothetical protein [Nocardioides sediminis]|uniref:hypothetical protein n=1 Tax=Nocardioides sediminis TaxID=433648 RepID=UPI00131F4715|nr:hypothetical protein [Nocardioides sediminis]
MRDLLSSMASGWHYYLATLVALAVGVWTLVPQRLGGAMMHPDGDSLSFVALVQNIVETGWYESGERLNAPFGQNVHGYALTDELLMGVVGKVFVPLFGSASAATNWWVTLTFPMAAVTAVYLARYLGLSRASSAVSGLAFAILPDHLLRTTGHYSLATTWVIPVVVLAALSLLHPRPMSGRSRVAWHGALLAGLVCVTLTNAYYAVFGGFLIMVAGVAAAVSTRTVRVLGHAVLRCTALGVPLVLTVWLDKRGLPSPLGYEAFAVTRSPGDADIYGGRITAMLLPAQSHRFEVFRDLRSAYETSFAAHAETPALGLVAALGFCGLVIWSLLAYWRPRWLEAHRRLSSLAGLTWVSVLVFATGGVGNAWAFVLDGGGIRVWSRMHVFIALLALLAVGLCIDALRRPLARALAVGGVLVVVLVDQTTPLYRPDTAATTAMKTEVEALTAAIAEDAGSGAAVYQYPEISYLVPQRETAPASLSDGFLPYVYSSEESGLRWSYGGLQGDPRADWQLALGQRPLVEQAALLSNAGFAGILVDRAPLTSTPDELAEIAQLGTPEVRSSSGRWEYHSLRSPGCEDDQREVAADMTVRPPLLYPGVGIDVSSAGMVNTEGDARLRILTLREGGWRRVSIGFQLSTGSASVTVRFPDGSTQDVGPGTTSVEWTGAARRTSTPVVLDRTAGDDRVVVQGLTATVVPPAGVARCLAEDS